MRIWFAAILVLCSFEPILAQCIPNLSGPDFEAVPDTIDNLPTAYYPSAYEATVQMYIPTDTFVDMLNLVLHLDSLFITGIDGLPPSFEYEVYPTAGPIPGGTPICLQITNNAVYEKVAGSYPIFIHVEAWSVGLPAHGDITGYVLNVEPLPVGIPEHGFPTTSNVVSDYLQLNKPTKESIRILDIQGKSVQIISPTTQTRIDLRHLPNGIYFIKIGDLTSKFLKVSP
jgi:hypothetical protein